ncbi:MAG: DUF2934 domain-containing protein [Blastocatellia bacterium]
MRINRKHDELLAETPETQQSSPMLDGQFNLSELIAQRAYELYEERGRGDGEELNDWLRAEAEVQALLSKPEQRRAAVNRTPRPLAASRASANR